MNTTGDLMMNRIELTFKKCRKEGRSVLIPYLVAGDPDLATTEALVREVDRNGADLIELGVPFSDPLADGATIQAASQRALEAGSAPEKVFKMAERLGDVSAPLILMTYYNPVLQYGLRLFAESCKTSRIEGVIIPDLPPEEGAPWRKEACRMGIDTIFLAAPTSPEARLKRVAAASRGFIYYVSANGVTGTREELPRGLESGIKRIKTLMRKPVAVGFGISNPDQVKSVVRFADGVIVGSAIVKIIQQNRDREDLASRVGAFVALLARASRK
jgi:tryptophan synthase alpha chain